MGTILGILTVNKSKNLCHIAENHWHPAKKIQKQITMKKKLYTQNMKQP